MGNEERNDGDRGRGGSAFEIALNRGDTSAAKAAGKAETKAVGSDGNTPHPCQFPEPPPNLSLIYDNKEDKDSDEY